MAQMMKEIKKKNKVKLRELTNNERTLITLLVIVVLFWFSFKYIIDPQNMKISTLESEINNYSLDIEKNNSILENKESIVNQKRQISIDKGNIERGFFKSLNQPNIIYILNNIFSNKDIEIESIDFSEPFIEILNGKDVQKMDVSIPFKGTFKSLNETIKNLETENRKIVINNIDIQKDEEKEIIGNINLGIYSLTGIVDGEDASLPIKITTKNKLNPFVPYRGYIDQNKIKEESLKQEISQNLNTIQVDEKPKEEKEEEKDEEKDEEKEKPIADEKYDIYVAVRGDNISYISRRKYGTESYVDEILRLNDMVRSSILPIGKKLKLKKK